MLKNTLVLLLLSSLFYSCKKSEKSDPEVKVETKVIDRDIAVSTIEDNPDHRIPQVDNKYNVLGYGYDITSRYADINSVRKPVVDLQKYIAVSPDRFNLLKNQQAGPNTMSGSDALELSKIMSLDYRNINKGFAAFKGTFTDAFPGADPFSEKYIYAHYTYTIQFGRLSAHIQYNLVKDFLTKEFNVDVQELSPELLVAKYGTHVLSSVLIGAKLTAIYQAETSSKQKALSLSYGFRYAMKKVFSLHTGFLDADDASLLNSIASPKIAFKYVGGDISIINQDYTSKTPMIRNIFEWFKTVTSDNSEFINVDQNGLVLLSDLIGDDVKKKAVEEYIKVYLTRNAVNLTK